MFSASYVGNQSHRLLVLVESNPGDPALCLSLSQTSEVAPGSATCGPFGESNVYTTAAGQTVNGTRGPLGPNFGSDTNQSTIGNANYNALELSLRHTSKRLQFFASYTFSKSMDQSSNVGEEVNPINPALSRALPPSMSSITSSSATPTSFPSIACSAFPIAGRKAGRSPASPISAAGFPVTLLNYGDNSLLGAEPNGINNYGVDEPQYTPGPLELNSNPRNGQSYFNTSLFSLQPLGTPGNAKRRFFYGPGIDNYDMALLKSVASHRIQVSAVPLRGFNVFNHAQFYRVHLR